MSERVERFAKSLATPAIVWPPPGAYRVRRDRFARRPSCAVVASLVFLAIVWSLASGSPMIGGGVTAFAAAAIVAGEALGRARRRASGRDEHRNSPRRREGPWASGGIVRGTGRRGGILSVLLGVGVIALTTLLGWTLARSSALALLFVLPALGGFWFLWTGIRELRARAVYARFPVLPAYPGDRLEILFGVDESGPSFRDADFVLRRIDRFREEDAGLWCTWSAESGPPDGILPGPGAEVRLVFDIPQNAPGTHFDGGVSRSWEFEVRGATDSGALRERFLVPIFDRPAGALA